MSGTTTATAVLDLDDKRIGDIIRVDAMPFDRKATVALIRQHLSSLNAVSNGQEYARIQPDCSIELYDQSLGDIVRVGDYTFKRETVIDFMSKNNRKLRVQAPNTQAASATAVPAKTKGFTALVQHALSACQTGIKSWTVAKTVQLIRVIIAQLFCFMTLVLGMLSMLVAYAVVTNAYEYIGIHNVAVAEVFSSIMSSSCFGGFTVAAATFVGMHIGNKWCNNTVIPECDDSTDPDCNNHEHSVPGTTRSGFAATGVFVVCVLTILVTFAGMTAIGH